MWLPRRREVSSARESLGTPTSAIPADAAPLSAVRRSRPLITTALARASTSAWRGSDAYGGRSIWCAVAALVRRGCPTVADVASRISSTGGIPGIAIRFRDLTVYQKLLPHLGEAGTAVFAVKDVE